MGKKAVKKSSDGATVKKKAKKKAKRRTKKAAESIGRQKVFWGVFNQSLKRVALFEFNEKDLAEAKAASLTDAPEGTPHFVQRVKEVVEIV